MTIKELVVTVKYDNRIDRLPDVIDHFLHNCDTDNITVLEVKEKEKEGENE